MSPQLRHFTTLTNTAACVSCQSLWQLSGTIHNHLFNHQTWDTDMLKSQLQSHAHKNPTPTHKHLFCHSFSFCLTRTHTHIHTTHTHLDTDTDIDMDTHTYTHHTQKLYQSTGPMPPWLRCMYCCSMPPAWICSVLSCPPWGPVSLSAKPSGLYQTKQWGVSLNCTAGSSRMTDSLGSLLLLFNTLDLHQVVLLLCTSSVSSVEKPLCLSLLPLLFPFPLSPFSQEAE